MTASPPSHAYMAPSVPKFAYVSSGEDVKDLTDEDLYSEVMECGVPLLDLIVKMARGYQKGNPVALLSKAIALAACDVPKASILTGIGGRPLPLNFLFCLVGPSGLGKGITLDAPMTTATPLTGYRSVTPASGEALIASFFDSAPAADGRGNETIRHDEPVWASWGEIDAFAAKSGNVNSTLDAILRSLFSGEAAGDSSISRMKAGLGTRVEENTYRFVMFVGAQPDHAGILLEDSTGGTLQRLLWLPLTDDDAPETAADIRAYRTSLETSLGMPKGSLRYKPPTLAVWGPRGNISLASDIEDMLLENRSRLLRRLHTVDPLDAHADNLCLRLAAVFAGWRAGMGGAVIIDREAWWWGQCILALSRRVRDDCKDHASVKKTMEARDAGRNDSERFMAREAALETAEQKKRETLMSKMEGYLAEHRRVTRSELSRSVANSRNRKYFDIVIREMVHNGDVDEVRVGNVTHYVYAGKH